MRTSISQGFAAFVVIAAFAASAVSAQTGDGTLPHARPQLAGQIADGSHTDVPSQPEAKPGNGPAVVSADVLRHPITARVRQLLRRAMRKMDSGDHETAIGQLQQTLTKHPDSAPYVYNLLGVEYVKTDQFQAAVSSLEQAVSLLPHDAMTHYNFGLALICAGDYDRATQEVRRAVELDPANTQMQARLNALLEHNRSRN